MQEPEADVLKALVDLQAQTPCRKCKGKDWAQKAGYGEAKGTERVGIYVVMGPPTDRVAVVTFECKGCGASFPRPLYSKEQLASQQYPAIQLDAKLEAEKPRTKKRSGGGNGTSAH